MKNEEYYIKKSKKIGLKMKKNRVKKIIKI
jgi:hypothetical protein